MPGRETWALVEQSNRVRCPKHDTRTQTVLLILLHIVPEPPFFVGDVGTASEHCLLASSRRGYYNSVALTEIPFTCLLRKLLLRLVLQ